MSLKLFFLTFLKTAPSMYIDIIPDGITGPSAVALLV